MRNIIIDVAVTLPVVLLFLWILYRWVYESGLAVSQTKHGTVAVSLNEETGSKHVPTREELLKVFAFGMGFRVFLYFVAVVIVNIFTEMESFQLNIFSFFIRSDANSYIQLVDLGYDKFTENGQHLTLVFFPLYVWIVRIVSFIIPDILVAAMTVSSLCYSWGCCWLYRLASEIYGKAAGRATVLAITFFPFAFFFGGIMTEGLFLLTVSASCYYAMKHKWLLFALWGALASITRMTGILVVLVAFMELVRHYQLFKRPFEIDSLKKILVRLPLIAIPIVGTLTYLGLNYFIDGDPFAFIIHQKHWNQGSMWISKVFEYMLYYLGEEYNELYGVSIWIPNITLFILFFVLLVFAMINKKNSSPLMVYGFAYLIANYSLSWLLSAGRYMSCGIVFFILIGAMVHKNKIVQIIFYVVEFALMLLYYYIFLLHGTIL
jgi:hypothetical protein